MWLSQYHVFPLFSDMDFSNETLELLKTELENLNKKSESKNC